MPETNALKATIENLLKSIPNLATENGELKINKIKEEVENANPQLLEVLLKNKTVKKEFFTPVLDSFIFKTREFKEFLDFSFACNSYSKYLGKKIGLYFADEELTDKTEVVLNFPFKDCVLEGGQTKEDGLDTFYKFNEKTGKYEDATCKRKEIFYNQILARDEIDSLFSPKAFTNAKVYDKTGQKPCTKLNRDAEINKKRGLDENTITDNLIIKGNNLLALHSLKEEFAGKVKLVYIDPPYNTGSDSFSYNDNFNHSSWLTFMKNRLEIAKELLKDDGAIFVQCDDNEQAYLQILMNEIFDFIQVVTIKMNEGAANEFQNPFMPKNCEYGLLYAKNYRCRKYKPLWIERKYDTAYNKFIINKKEEKDFHKWEVKSVNEILKERNIEKENVTDFVIENADCIFQGIGPKEPGEGLKNAMERSKKSNSWDIYNRENKEDIYTYRGRMVRFYSKNIGITKNGKKAILKELGSLWSDIKTTGIAPEGGVTLKNAKKPEMLLSRIIEMLSEENDIVLDFHLGSGTTAAVAHKMNRQYIGIEQLDYGKNDSVVRLKNVINGDTTGISKSVSWQGGGSFVYFELAQKNQKAIALIQNCSTYEELVNLFEELSKKYFLHYNVKINEFLKEIKLPRFKELPLEKQKEMFCRMLDLNQLYVNFSDRNDETNNLTKDDITFTQDFYSSL
ncbi:site-specific DNA-methyltransferase [Treponema berlinense]|uniref:site-specific DNA-methyltransferase n=1 Tax=Treponema berlinense TaxID=225004 RepID=UPI003FD8EC8F